MGNPLKDVTRTARDAVTHPVATAEAVAGEAMHLAGSALHMGGQVVGAGARTAGHVAGSALERLGLLGRSEESQMVWDPEEKEEAAEAAFGEAPTIEEAAAAAVAREEAAGEDLRRQERERELSGEAGGDRPAAGTEAAGTTEWDGVRTPSGIPAADRGYNPDTAETDLAQPDTPEPMDPGTVHAVESESEILRKAADTDKS